MKERLLTTEEMTDISFPNENKLLSRNDINVLREYMNLVENESELRSAYAALRCKLDNYCRDFTVSRAEARMFNISRAGLLAGVLGGYRELIEEEMKQQKRPKTTSTLEP